ncbi:D-sedoheptulose-7-phosphate isomerase [Actinomadura algeriensis]|uniref:D-sedoheptulose 7-phosphate isomerase n=1 Tax=Actinomadura algeriensis TaxID=1679523 RepID=A0ABR9JNN1_9ACTN|nr:SIS domain-containing protein [Actinomadura algeriensis]MBE1532176.1 D-sedoheptulose 7-phosphate isomerase [Actinomadura algeriensis]
MTARTAVREAFDRRTEPGRAVAADADAIARACHAMAVRFHAGGRLIVFGNGGACTDAQHVAVEFVHPVVVGKRALPAFALTGDVATLTAIARTEGFDEVYAAQLRTLARPDDIALGLSDGGPCANVRRGLAVAAEMGLLTVALTGGDGDMGRGADHVLRARTADPLVAKEVHVTVYHVLWELVHVFFEHPGTLRRETAR